mgnify:CR=1 FL=1
MTLRVTMLGCGGSGGVPLTGGVWGDCDPADPRNRRRRPSILVEHAGGKLLVDTSPDLREQLLDADVRDLDAVLFTHAHADHCHGIDDLRALVYARGAPIPAFGTAATMADLTQRFAYAFSSSKVSGAFYSALLTDHTITPRESFTAAGLSCTAFEQSHGTMPTVGYRIGPVGYSPDAAEIEAAGFDILSGVGLWIVDCLREAPHPTHAHMARTLSWIARVRPGRAVLTHMNHTLDYAHAAALCPPGVEPGRDGLVIEVPEDPHGQAAEAPR